MRLIQLVSAGLVASAYTTMVLGAYVKAIGAGMACSEWPTCNGGALVGGLDNAGVAAEMVHRFAATSVLALGITLLVLEFVQYRSQVRLMLLTGAAGAVLGVQVALGAITISSNLTPVVVTAHQAVAVLFFAMTILIAVRVFALPPPAVAASSPAPAAPTDGSKAL